MKKNSALLLSGLLLAMACKDTPSGPQASSLLSAPQNGSNALSFQPPPPLEGYFGGSSASTSFTVGVTYFMNGPENNGWISFAKNQPAGVSLSSPSARITIRNRVASGKGLLTIAGVGVIDLASGILEGGDFRGSCSATEGFVGTADVIGGGSCGSFSFTTTLGKTGFITIRAGTAPPIVVGY